MAIANLTIHDAPDDVLRSLEQQADAAGLSLDDYLVARLHVIAGQPASDDGSARLAHSDDAETLAVLSDESAMQDIADGDAAHARGDVLRGEDAVRALRPQVRS